LDNIIASGSEGDDGDLAIDHDGFVDIEGLKVDIEDLTVDIKI
jgi:hypothetical protein